MLLFFAFFGSCFDVGYSLLPPFALNNVSEVGNWSLRGSAVSLKNKIRLTSDLENQFGRVCELIPAYFIDWSIDIELSVHGGNGGKYFMFFFTRDVCPTNFRTFDGIAIIVSLEKINNKYDVYLIEGNVHYLNINTMAPLGHIYSNTNDDDPKKFPTLHITRAGGHITLETSASYNMIFYQDAKETIDYGYFSFVGMTDQSYSNIDIDSVMINKISNEDESSMTSLGVKNSHPVYSKVNNAEDFLAVNRKVIEKNEKEKQIKKAIRSLKIPTATSLRQYMDKTMENVGTFTMYDALKIVSELENRGKSTISLNDLSSYIENTVVTKINKAYSGIENTANNITLHKEEIKKLWGNLFTELFAIVKETERELQQIKLETIETIKKLDIVQVDADLLKSLVHNQVESELSTEKLNTVLLIIAGIEIIIYSVFFTIKHKQTHGFTKRD